MMSLPALPAVGTPSYDPLSGSGESGVRRERHVRAEDRMQCVRLLLLDVREGAMMIGQLVTDVKEDHPLFRLSNWKR